MKKSKLILLLLLVVLNVVIRIPSFPHENGNDSFMLHTLANSISQFGEAKWWLNLYSIFGMYSYSYGSVIPFLLSGIQQLTNIEMEYCILLLSIPLGLLCMFSTYIFASTLSNDYVFKLIFSMFYSISLGILQFTVWNSSSRGIFLVILPLFLYIMLTEKLPLMKKVPFLLVIFLFQRSAHNFSYFLVPIVCIYIFSASVFKYDLLKLNTKYAHYHLPLYSFILLLSFLLPFFSGLFIVGSKYQAFLNALITTVRYIGPLILFSVIGLLFVSFKKDKSHKDWFILYFIVILFPMFYSIAYGPFILLLPIICFISIGFSNLFNVKHKSKLLNLGILSLLLFSVAFSSYYTQFRPSSSGDYWFMDERTNVAGIWVRNAFDENTRIFTSGGEIWRLTAIANGHAVFPTLPAVDLVYGFVDAEQAHKNTVKLELGVDYFFDGPYIQKQGTSLWGSYAWVSNFEIDDPQAASLIATYGLKYAVFDIYTRSKITRNVDALNGKIYDNSRITIYPL